ncbi:MAG: hypothetical protein QF570_22235 [Myxococcota bacterium]|nr:hypothetical protein [Myxococcota bacterium]
MQSIRFEVKPEQPYSLARTAARLVRFTTLVDRLDASGAYSRCLHLAGSPAVIEVEQLAPPSRPRLAVRLRGPAVRGAAAREDATRFVLRSLGAGCRLQPFYRKLARDPFLERAISEHRGMALCGGATLWEAMVTSILAQQVNLQFAYSIYDALTLRYGDRIEVAGESRVAFPTPERLARVRETTLRGFKLSAAKAGAIRRVASAFAKGELDEGELDGLDDEAVIARLVAYKGIGRWTAETSLIRGLGRLDVFPAGDLGVVKRLAIDMLGRDGVAREQEMRDFAERWRPHRSLALIYAYAALYGAAPAAASPARREKKTRATRSRD